MLQVFSSTQEMDRNGLISKMLGETAKPPSCRGCTVALLSFDTQIASTCPFGQPFVSSPIWALCHGRAADSCHIHVLPRGISERLLGVKSVQREIDLKLYHLYIYIINTCRNKKPLENYDPFFSVSHALIISAAHQTRKWLQVDCKTTGEFFAMQCWGPSADNWLRTVTLWLSYGEVPLL